MIAQLISGEPGSMVAIGAVILAGLVVLRAIGELFIKIGNLGKYAAKDNDWFDSAGAFLLHIVDGLGRIFAFVGIGNRPKD